MHLEREIQPITYFKTSTKKKDSQWFEVGCGEYDWVDEERKEVKLEEMRDEWIEFREISENKKENK